MKQKFTDLPLTHHQEVRTADELGNALLGCCPVDAPGRNRPRVVIVIADCRFGLAAMALVLKAFFAGIVTSPPYFGQRNNGHGAAQIGLGSLAEYRAAMLNVLAYLLIVARSHTLLWLNMGDKCAGGGNGAPGKNAKIQKDTNSRQVASSFEPLPHGYYPREKMDLPGLCKVAAKDAGWKLIDTVIWYKGGTLAPPEGRLANNYECILQLVNRKCRKWDLYKDALPEDLQQCEENVWFIRPNPNEAAGIFGVDHSSTFPPELAGAAAVMSAKPGEWILDPFGGLGNTAIGAARFKLNTVLIEQNPEYAWAAAAQLLSLPDEFRPEVSVIVRR
jgi:site-specific DNA-methyltransferase (adenine-specific)